MTKPIVQSVTFKASPEELFALFTDSKKHSAATGAKATVSAKAGPSGQLSGECSWGRTSRWFPVK